MPQWIVEWFCSLIANVLDHYDYPVLKRGDGKGSMSSMGKSSIALYDSLNPAQLLGGIN